MDTVCLCFTLTTKYKKFFSSKIRSAPRMQNFQCRYLRRNRFPEQLRIWARYQRPSSLEVAAHRHPIVGWERGTKPA
jgi:hypothetical protein